MEITLNILAEDIRKDNYFDTEECPVTLAYAKAGHPELIDRGRHNDKFDYTDEHLEVLVGRLFGMYNSIPGNFYSYSDTSNKIVVPPAIPIEDFSVTLVFEEPHNSDE